jgi:hypothetical protein
MIYYKIRYKDDPEKYVKGTPVYLSYDKTGRIFQSLGQLRTFLTSVMNADARYSKRDETHRNRVADWEVVELEMVVKEVKGVHEVITAKKLKEMLMK